MYRRYDPYVIFVAALIVLGVVLLGVCATEARAHSTTEIEAWLEKWRTDRFFSAADMAAFEDFADRHRCYFYEDCPSATVSPGAQAGSTYRGMGANVAQWEGLVAVYFGSETWRALCLMSFESGGNPNALNPASGARGLMQIMPFWAYHFGYQPNDLYEPGINLQVAAWVREAQGWSAWSPYQRGECR